MYLQILRGRFASSSSISNQAFDLEMDDLLVNLSLGVGMQAYYGGRAEIRIRHTPVPFIYTDFVSQYPTVNTLMKLWPLLIAESVHTCDVTEEVRQLMQTMRVDDLFNPNLWPKLTFFALVEPNDDILPVRTIYGTGDTNTQTNIGLNPLTSSRPLWFAGPDVVASFLLTGRTPKIVRAIRFEPVGVQPGMQAVNLGTGLIHPYKDDFFRKIIEERKGKSKTDSLYYFLKILANAGCYGVYAELNRVRVGKNAAKQIGIFSGEEFRTRRTCDLELPGMWFFPPISALITAGGRLSLALLQALVDAQGGSYLMCDTDSMAIVATEKGGLAACHGGEHTMPDGRSAIKALSREAVQRIVDRFEALNPYDKTIVPGSILRIDDVNFGPDGNQRQLFGYGISAKRYALYTKTSSAIDLVKVSEHGLGLYYRPKEGHDPECGVAAWIKEGWYWLLCRELGLPCSEPSWFDVPVIRRIAITTPNVMAALRKLDRAQARPYNFAISPVIVNLSGMPVTLIGPFENNPGRWSEMIYTNIHDGSTHKLNKGSLLVVPQTFEMIFAQYHRHPEHKSMGSDAMPCRAESAGLLQRYPVTASDLHLIGKETERGWEQSEDVSTLLPSLVCYEQTSQAISLSLRERLREIPLDTLEEKTGLSRHTIVRARKGNHVHRRTVRTLRDAAL